VRFRITLMDEVAESNAEQRDELCDRGKSIAMRCAGNATPFPGGLS
jgi:hypothetical protein